MDESIRIIDTDLDNVLDFGQCGYKSMKKEGLPQKYEWLTDRFPEGLRIKTLVSEDAGTQGMIEYVPGEYCWRPVSAKGYMMVHCIFVGFKKEYKKQGYGGRLLDLCVEDAKTAGMKGVAAVCRKGSFMAGRDIFTKAGFSAVDTAAPDFELMVLSFVDGDGNAASNLPSFNKEAMAKTLKSYSKGVTIVRADQCPYTVKNVREMREAARKEFGIDTRVVNLKTAEEAQKAPSPFGVFSLIVNGHVEACHPISKTRFINILKKDKISKS